jgi:hypothetical protein
MVIGISRCSSPFDTFTPPNSTGYTVENVGKPGAFKYSSCPVAMLLKERKIAREIDRIVV